MEAIKTSTMMEEVIEFLSSSPTPQQILDFMVSDATQERIDYLLDKNRNERLNDAEHAEMNETLRMDHFMTLLKARIHKKLRQQK